MPREDIDYSLAEFDERLFTYETCCIALMIDYFPPFAMLDKHAMRKAFLTTHEKLGHVRRTTGSNGRVRLEPTEKFPTEFLKSE